MNTETVLLAYKKARNKLKELEKNIGLVSNTLKSSLFVESIGQALLNQTVQTKFKLVCQTVDLDRGKKKTGEWLLDAIIAIQDSVEERAVNKTTPKHFYYKNLEWAIESEYATSLKAFLDDFSKLLTIHSENKLYLNGYASTNEESFDQYSTIRLSTAAALIKESNSDGFYYFAFWPSPQLVNNPVSIKKCSFWEVMDKHEKMLVPMTRIYKYSNGEFIEL